jgi:hypothetical protein
VPRGSHLHTVEITQLRDLSSHLGAIADADLVLVVTPGSEVVDSSRVREAYSELDGAVVVAATAVPAVDAELADAHPHTSSPYRFVAPALIGPAGALRGLGAVDEIDLTKRYLAGEDLELDVGATVFLVRDGTGTDALVVGDEVVATATGTRPPVVIGGAPQPGVARHDLARVIAYEDAVDARDDMSVVAPEIIVTPFWTPSFCSGVVHAAEAAAAWGADPTDPVPGLEVSLATISPPLFDHVEQHVGRVIVPRLRTAWPEFAWTGLQDAFVIKYVAGDAGSDLPLHHDVAQLSASVRLNDGYAGGRLEFPRQGWDNHAVDVGNLVVWPSLVTHPHRSTRVERGVKYGLTVWVRLPA